MVPQSSAHMADIYRHTVLYPPPSPPALSLSLQPCSPGVFTSFFSLSTLPQRSTPVFQPKTIEQTYSVASSPLPTTTIFYFPVKPFRAVHIRFSASSTPFPSRIPYIQVFSPVHPTAFLSSRCSTILDTPPLSQSLFPRVSLTLRFTPLFFAVAFSLAFSSLIQSYFSTILQPTFPPSLLPFTLYTHTPPLTHAHHKQTRFTALYFPHLKLFLKTHTPFLYPKTALTSFFTFATAPRSLTSQLYVSPVVDPSKTLSLPARFRTNTRTP